MCKEGSLRKLSDEASSQVENSVLDNTGLAQAGDSVYGEVKTFGKLFNTDQFTPGGTWKDTGDVTRDAFQKMSHHASGAQYPGSGKGSSQTGSGSGYGDEDNYENADQLDEMSFANNQFLRKRGPTPKSRLYHLKEGTATTLTANMS